MRSSTATFYNRFSLFYPLIDLFLQPQKKRLFTEINKLRPGKLLEIGVGNGAHLKQYSTHSIIGIDNSGKMLALAKKQAGQNIALLHMNGEQLLFADQSFDYIVLSHVIAVVQNPERLLEEAHRVVKPGGQVFILNHFTPDNWLKYADNCFSFLAKRFNFRSAFYMNELDAFKKFTLMKEISFGRLSYFKLLIYRRP